MSYIILMDSCGDCSEELKASGRLASIPLRIQVDDEVFCRPTASSTANCCSKKSPACKKRLQSSCPSPGDYLAEYEKHAGQRIYVVTGTSALTGSYNSAPRGSSAVFGCLPQRPDRPVRQPFGLCR